MRSFLFLALLACSIANGLGQGTYQYHDSQGRCWSCSDDSSCIPCADTFLNMFVTIPPTYPRSCPVPDCTLVENRQALYPVVDDPRYFYQCVQQNGNGWTPVRLACQCGTYFDVELGNCQFPWDWVPWCTTLPTPLPPPIPCDNVPTTEPTTFAPPTTEPATTAAPAPCQPCCMPCMIWWMCPPCQNVGCNNGCAMG